MVVAVGGEADGELVGGDRGRGRVDLERLLVLEQLQVPGVDCVVDGGVVDSGAGGARGGEDVADVDRGVGIELDPLAAAIADHGQFGGLWGHQWVLSGAAGREWGRVMSGQPFRRGDVEARRR